MVGIGGGNRLAHSDESSNQADHRALLGVALSKLPSDWHRLAFGLACCERVYGNYLELFRAAGVPTQGDTRRAMDAFWSSIGSREINIDLDQLYVEIVGIALEEEEFSGITQPPFGVAMAYLDAFLNLVKYAQSRDISFLLKCADWSLESVRDFIFQKSVRESGLDFSKHSEKTSRSWNDIVQRVDASLEYSSEKSWQLETATSIENMRDLTGANIDKIRLLATPSNQSNLGYET